MSRRLFSKFVYIVVITYVWCVEASSSIAQPNFIISNIPARWYWEASSDDGATWARDSLQVQADATSIRVRSVCEFVGPSNTYYGGASFDATVSGQGDAGSTDTIPLDSVSRCQVLSNLPELAVSRWGRTVKIDYWDDHFAPGVGPYWASSSQSAPFRGPHVAGNPICTFAYTINLDGTHGDRTVGAIFAPEPFFGPGAWIRLYRENDFSEVDNVYIHPVEQHGLTIRVVPTPGVIAAMVVFGIGCSRRRRGESK